MNTITVFSSSEIERWQNQMLWNGLVALAAGVLLWLVPQTLNFLVALLILIFGVSQVIVARRELGATSRQLAGWLIVAFGFMALVAPAILNFLVIGFLLFVIVVIAVASMRLGAPAWGWFLLALGFLAGGLILAFPYALNRIFGVFLLILGIEQLVFRAKLRN